MTDEQDIDQESPGSPLDAEQPKSTEPSFDAGRVDEEGAEAGEEHPIKEGAREAVAKAVGVAVELGSILGGEGGDIVEAQRTVAEADTEDLIDRIDGEG